MMSWWSSTQYVTAPRAAPPDACPFAIGDIHGHAQELEALHTVISDLARHSSAMRKTLVYLGDYLDRGPEIVRTIQLLMAQQALNDGLERVFLVGNHDQFVVELLDAGADVDLGFVTMWLENGGDATLAQLDMEGYGRKLMAGDMRGFSALLRQALGSPPALSSRAASDVPRWVLYVRACGSRSGAASRRAGSRRPAAHP
jgi:hypothetical protein